MNGRRAVIGLCMLCALMLSGVAAQSASAVTKGTTAFTCKKGVGVGPETFAKEHCKKSDGPGEYGHFEFKEKENENTTTEIEVTNAKTNAATNGPETTLFQETIGGVPLELQGKTVTGTGTLTNKKDPTTGEHYIEGTATYAYHEVTVTKPEKGCKVFTDETATKTPGTEGTVDVHLDFTSKGQGDFINFTPAASTKPGTEAFATFFISGCSPAVPAIEGTWEITGSAKCPTDGATIKCSHTEITTQNTLKGKGNKAGIQGPITILGRDPTLKEVTYTPLSTTTVETP
jgi:hypothetical protein